MMCDFLLILFGATLTFLVFEEPSVRRKELTRLLNGQPSSPTRPIALTMFIMTFARVLEFSVAEEPQRPSLPKQTYSLDQIALFVGAAPMIAAWFLVPNIRNERT